MSGMKERLYLAGDLVREIDAAYARGMEDAAKIAEEMGAPFNGQDKKWVRSAEVAAAIRKRAKGGNGD